ncbi:MAG: alpha/beta hydrolase [Rhodobacteraceae bacterium]|nr:alpha/beta hydrolase [Paracoccaceae bacterium]
MFEGFTEEYREGAGINLFVRHAGNPKSPAVLLLHGYPQTSAMWRDVAPLLARQFHAICPDLRGYGRSDKPSSDGDHSPYSKRAMAEDFISLMQGFGHERYFIAGHDRGGRVAHRLGMDHPQSPIAMSLIDIAPTREMYANSTAEFARAYWHWFFLIQNHPLPETLIEAAAEEFWLLKCLRLAGADHPFSDEALSEYLTAFQDPAVIHATCEDYRAAVGIDIQHDDADGDRKLAMPIQLIWAANGVIGKCFEPLRIWKLRAEYVEGLAVDGTHYLVEEHPEFTARQLTQFFQSHIS